MTDSRVAVPTPSRSADIKDRIISAAAVPQLWGLSMVLWGQPGVGKTPLAATAQDSEYGRDVIFIAPEAGMASIADRKDVMVFPTDEWGDFAKIEKFLSKSEHTYRTFVLDTVDAMQKMARDKVLIDKGLSDEEQLTLPMYGRANEMCLTFIDKLRVLSTQRGWNMIIIAHDETEKDELMGGLITRLSVSAGLAKAVVRMVDAIGYMSVGKDKTDRTKLVRTLEFQPTTSRMGKMRLPLTGPQVPLTLTGERISLAPILKALRERRDAK